MNKNSLKLRSTTSYLHVGYIKIILQKWQLEKYMYELGVNHSGLVQLLKQKGTI